MASTLGSTRVMRPRSAPRGSIAARVLVRVVDFVVARGHDGDALCREASLSLAVLRDPEARIPYEVAERLAEAATRLVNDPNIGLHIAQDVRDTRSFDAGALMLMASPTVRAAIERMERYQRYWGDGPRAVTKRVAGGLLLRYSLPAPERSQRHNDECAMAEIVLGIRVLSAQELSPRALRFRHAAPPDIREHVALFRCPIVFDAPHTELELADETLEVRMPHANETYFTIFEEQVSRALASLPSAHGTSDAVRAAARATLAGGECSLEGAAAALGISARTLQRRLHNEGTSFGQLVDALRREMAHAYLAKGASQKEIAWLLGYADATAFHHAFKRWTGTTPRTASAD